MGTGAEYAAGGAGILQRSRGEMVERAFANVPIYAHSFGTGASHAARFLPRRLRTF